MWILNRCARDKTDLFNIELLKKSMIEMAKGRDGKEEEEKKSPTVHWYEKGNETKQSKTNTCLWLFRCFFPIPFGSVF